MVEAEAKDGVTTLGGLQGAHHDIAHQQEGLTAATTAEQHDVRG